MGINILNNIGLSSLNIDLWGAMLNFLGILGVVVFGAFIVVFISDLLISIIDDKNGIFFKRHKVEKRENQYENIPVRPKMLQEPKPIVENVKKEDLSDFDKEYKRIESQSKVDFTKADQEEKELMEKLALNSRGEIKENEELAFSPKEDLVPIVKAREVDGPDITDKISSKEEIDAFLKKMEEDENSIYDEDDEDDEDEEDNQKSVDEEDDDENYYYKEYQDIIDSITKETIDEESKGIMKEEIPEMSEEEKVFFEEPIVIESPKIAEKPDNVVKEEVKEELVDDQDKIKIEEANHLLEEEIQKLREELEKERAEMAQIRIESIRQSTELANAKSKLEEELRIAKENQYKGEEITPNMLSIEEYQQRLEILHERLKANDKQLRLNKRELNPLERVKKTLDRDKQKLRRKEALVAKQKVMLYGVNNFTDIDEDKAKKLSEDLDLLDGLRMSVQHCEEVMEANKDRYPILDQTNNILTSTRQDILKDIKEIEEALAKLNVVDGEEE